MQQPRPFQLQYSASVAALLQHIGCSLAISTYQAGKVIFISPQNDSKLIQLPRSFVKAMGIALEGDQLALACKDEVITFRRSKDLAPTYPNKPGVYDNLFLPRATYHTGSVDIHDLDYCEEGLCAVITNFSCIARIDENYSFTPIWTPPFITRATAGDHCHLNGMAVSEGKIKYVTAFAPTDNPRAWTTDLANTGLLISYDSKEILLDQLGMPHSPRLYNGNLYLLESAKGQLIRVNTQSALVNWISLNMLIRQAYILSI